MLAAIRGRNRSESPTRFSEISLRRYRKNLRSKKSSAAMSADEEAVSGHRSVSMSTLSLNGANSVHSDQPGLANLETVEAKMAGIESSLSTSSGTHRRKKEPAPTIATRDLLKELEKLHNALKDKDQLILSLRSQIMSVCQRHASQEQERVARERERTVLHERLQQLQQQGEQRRAHCKNLRLQLEKLETSENIDHCIKQAELEYELEREELNILNLQGEQQTLRAKLEDTDSAAYGTSRISVSSCLPSNAETSLHLVSLQYDPRSPSFTINSHISGVGVLVEWAMDGSGLRKGDRLLEMNGQHVFGHRKEAFLQLLAVSSSPLRLLAVRCLPPSLAMRRGNARETTALREEISLLAQRLEQKTRENKQLHAEKERYLKESETHRGENMRLHHRIGYLEEQVHEMSNDLDKIKGVTDESLRRTKKSDVHVFTKGPHTATIPVNGRASSNGSENDTSSIETPQTASPARRSSSTTDPEEDSQRPLSPSVRSETSTRPPSSQKMEPPPTLDRLHPHIYQNIRPKIKQKPRNILQRLQQLGERRHTPTPPPSCGGVTTDSEMGSSYSINTLDKPRPPKKPVRLSLHRATSVQSVKSADDTLVHSTSASRRQQRGDTVQTWPSVDRNLDQVRQRSNKVYHNIASLPRLGKKDRGQLV